MKFFVACLAAVVLIMPSSVNAAQGQTLFWYQYWPNPKKTKIAGPFDTLSECLAAAQPNPRSIWNAPSPDGYFVCEVTNS